LIPHLPQDLRQRCLNIRPVRVVLQDSFELLDGLGVKPCVGVDAPQSSLRDFDRVRPTVTSVCLDELTEPRPQVVITRREFCRASHMPHGFARIAPGPVYLGQSNARRDIFRISTQHPAKLPGGRIQISDGQQGLRQEAVAFYVAGIMAQNVAHKQNGLVRLTRLN
jgi:hypothetical protein